MGSADLQELRQSAHLHLTAPHVVGQVARQSLGIEAIVLCFPAIVWPDWVRHLLERCEARVQCVVAVRLRSIGQQ
jgi:hypothetical protein